MSDKKTTRSPELKKDLTTRLKRIEGQVRGIVKMVDEDRYCDDIINQLSAANAALKSVSRLVLDNHIRSCLVRDIQKGDEGILDELIGTIDQMMKSR